MLEFDSNIIFNNLQIPFIVGAWEKYLKSTFVVLLKFADDREKAFKEIMNKIKILPRYMESFSHSSESVEWVLTEWLSFQRPKSIIENYKMVNKTLDINSIFAKPIPERTDTLLASIDHIVDIRNDIVHAANINTDVTNDVLSGYIADFCNAVESIYKNIGEKYNLALSTLSPTAMNLTPS
jgi:hypothetical protein